MATMMCPVGILCVLKLVFDFNLKMFNCVCPVHTVVLIERMY